MSNPRTSATLLPDSPQLRDPVTEPDAMEAAILADLRSNYQFEASAGTGLSPERPGDECGWLFGVCKLSWLRLALGIHDELHDDEIFSALDRLQQKKAVIVSWVEQSRFDAANDYRFELVLGTACKGKRAGFNFDQVSPHWLSKSSFKLSPKKPVVSVSEAVDAINRRVRERLDRSGGRIMPDRELEARLHREALEDEARLKAAIMNLASRFGDLDEVTARRLLRLVDGKDEK